jgi:hypothetical protein
LTCRAAALSLLPAGLRERRERESERERAREREKARARERERQRERERERLCVQQADGASAALSLRREHAASKDKYVYLGLICMPYMYA